MKNLSINTRFSVIHILPLVIMLTFLYTVFGAGLAGAQEKDASTESLPDLGAASAESNASITDPNVPLQALLAKITKVTGKNVQYSNRL